MFAKFKNYDEAVWAALYGSLLNTIIDFRSGTDFGGFFGSTALLMTRVSLPKHPGRNRSRNFNAE